MLEEIKIIPGGYSPESSPKVDAGGVMLLPDPTWEPPESSVSVSGYEEDKALMELWPHQAPSPRTPPSLRTAPLWAPSPAQIRTPPPTLPSYSAAPLPPVLEDPRQPAPSRARAAPAAPPPPKQSSQNRARRAKVQFSPDTRPPAPAAPLHAPDPAFDRCLWRRGTVVQLFDKHAEQWLEAAVTRVQRNAFGTKSTRRDPNKDGLHLLYKPLKKLKGSWFWKDHKPMKRRPRRRLRVSAIKEEGLEGLGGDVEWETTILLARNSKRLRAAVRVVWDAATQSYFHEEPEECSSSESEPEEYSSGEEAEEFWTRFQDWKGVGKAPPSWSAETPKSATQSYGGTQRTQQSQGTFGSQAASSKLSSKPSQLGSVSATPKSMGAVSHWTSPGPVGRDDTESSSEGNALL